MRGEYPKGGTIFLGYSPPFERGANLLGGGGGKSPVTKAWANSSTFLKIISCPPKYEFAPQMPPPPNSEAWRDAAATGKGFSVAKSKFYPEIW